MKVCIQRCALLAGAILLSTCSREWNNPYDPDVPVSDWSPTELRIQFVDEQSVDLHWEAVASVEVDYRIQRATFGTMDSLGEFSDVLTTRSTSALDNSLSTATARYVYRLTAQAEERFSDPAPDRLVTWTDQGELLWQSTNEGEVVAAATRSDHRMFMTATTTGQVRIWDLEAKVENNTVFPVHTLNAPGGLISAAISPDGGLVVTGHMDGEVHAFNVASGSESWQALHPQEAGGWPYSISISPAGDQVLSAGGDRVIRAWDAKSGSQKWKSDVFQYGCISTAYSPDGNFAAGGSMDSTFRVFDQDTGSERFRGQHAAGGDELLFSPNSEYLVSRGWREIGVWSTSTGERLWLYRNLNLSWFPKSRFSEDSQQLVCEDRDRLLILNAQTGQMLQEIALPGMDMNQEINALVLHPNQKLAYIGNEMGQLKIVDLETQTILWSTELEHGISFLNFSPGGTSFTLVDDNYLGSAIQCRGAIDTWVTSNW